MGISKTHIHSAKENEYATIAKVLAHPARIAILTYVASSPGCLCKDIADRIKLSQPTTSQHIHIIQRLKVLEIKFIGGVMFYTLNLMAFSRMKEGLTEYLEIVERKNSKWS